MCSEVTHRNGFNDRFQNRNSRFAAERKKKKRKIIQPLALNTNIEDLKKSPCVPAEASFHGASPAQQGDGSRLF